jgi:hypothetical protein
VKKAGINKNTGLGLYLVDEMKGQSESRTSAREWMD